MDRYSHKNYATTPSIQGGFKRKLMTSFILLLITAMLIGYYLYKPHPAWLQKMANNVRHIANENTLESKNDPTPPIHFEFYTALANAKMSNEHPEMADKVVITTPEQIEKEIKEDDRDKRMQP